MPFGSAGLLRKKKKRRKSLEGSQLPQQVGGLGGEEPSHSAQEEGPSAKTAQPSVRPRPGTTHPHSAGQSPDSFRKSPIVGTGRGRVGLNGQRELERS